jgi:GTPase
MYKQRYPLAVLLALDDKEFIETYEAKDLNVEFYGGLSHLEMVEDRYQSFQLRKRIKSGDKEAFKELIDLTNKMDERRIKTMSDEEFNQLNELRQRRNKPPLRR